MTMSSLGELSVVDLYSGIGGLHTALKAAIKSFPSLSLKSVRAFDVNTVANRVYQHNYVVSPSVRTIDSLGERDITGGDLWLMSPPCQPYTR